MPGGIALALRRWLDEGRDRVGQVLIQREAEGFSLRHAEDAGRGDVRRFSRPEDAREWAKYDDGGKYRPLKSAPNLRHGWELCLRSIDEVRTALDYLYPAMLGTVVAQERGELHPVNFRQTAGRQTGMYAIAARGNDGLFDEVIGRFCQSSGGCLKTILWQIDAGRGITTLPPEKFDPAIDQAEGRPSGSLPLLCAEACHLLISEVRGAVRATLKKQ